MRVQKTLSSLSRWLMVLLLSGGLVAAGAVAAPASSDEHSQNNSPQADAGTPATDAQAAETTAAGGPEGSEIDPTAIDATEKQRDRVIDEAARAIGETQRAVQALKEDDVKPAMKALETATGKLELIMARRPELALAPIDVRVVQTDLYATPEDVSEAVEQAQELLRDGELQEARLLVANLASEIVVETVNLPLATYPDAIKAAVPLIDAGDLQAAQRLLENALSTLVVRTEAVIPIPVVRAQELLAEAEDLAETE